MAKFDLAKFYEELMEIIRKGDEEGARNFILDHILDLPPDFQNEIFSILFQEGLERVVEDDNRLIRFQEIILEELRNIEKLRTQLEDQLRIEESREKIKKLLQKENNQKDNH